MYQLKTAYMALVMVMVFAAHTLANECDEINVVSSKGKYIKFDSQSLTIKDVGDLRWFGVQSIDLAFQSYSSKYLVLYADHIFDFKANQVVKTNTPFLIPPLSFENIKREIYFLPDSSFFTVGKWVEGTDLFASEQRIDRVTANLFLYDAVSRIPYSYKNISLQSPGNLAICRHNGITYSAGRRNLVKIEDGTLEYNPLPSGYGEEGYILGAMDYCKSLMLTRRMTEKEHTATYRVIDLTKNEVSAEFSAQTDAKQFLYSEGKLLAQQQLNYQKMKDYPNSARVIPTAQFRVIDTKSGKITKDVMLDRTYGVSDKLICKDTKPTLVIKEPYSIHLLDLDSMRIIKSTKLPFDTFHIQ